VLDSGSRMYPVELHSCSHVCLFFRACDKKGKNLFKFLGKGEMLNHVVVLL
jgi:hypothetical protein